MKLPGNINGDITGILAKFAGFGAGGVMAVAVIDILRSRPELTIKIISDWGAPFALVVIVMGVFNQRFGQLIQTGKENAQAMTSMAGAMDRIATRDDVREREQELLVNHLIAELKDVKSGISTILERGKAN